MLVRQINCVRNDSRQVLTVITKITVFVQDSNNGVDSKIGCVVLGTGDTFQITFSENQLFVLLFFHVCHPFLIIVFCMKECESTELQTLVVIQN